jgi:hypothetical protein
MSSRTSLLQTSNTPWTLTKTGNVDPGARTVTWTVTATPGATVDGKLTVDGFLDVANIGSGPATIGNIFVNLQSLVNGTWVTKASDIADATNGDAATSAHVVAAASSEHRTLFTEGPGSGALSFMDRATNTVWSLVPQITISPRATVRLLFAATFDNAALHLATGESTRTEVIVTFGNHPAGTAYFTDDNVDINGNGVIDPDEAKVRSVSTRFPRKVPASQAANATVTLADAFADIRTEGTVTVSDPVINLGQTTGTVTVAYDPGASGGAITNCAHATGTGVIDPVGTRTFTVVPPVSLAACKTQPIQAPTCTAGAPGCGWKSGDLLTYTQSDWGDDPNSLNGSKAASILDANYGTLYSAFVVGDEAGYVMIFGSASTLMRYLPANGTPGPLVADLLDPTSSASGQFGGDVAALKLNVDFTDVGIVHGTAAVRFGDLRVCNLPATPDLDHLTVRQALAALQRALAGVPTADTYFALDALARELNAAFFFGEPSTFTQDHLVNGACP